MMERRRIVDFADTGAARALVTLVRAEGSSYRRPGARLLAGTNNVYAGTISGGCLEAEVTRKAAWLVRNGPVVERYSTLFDDTAEIPYGLGCGGTVDLLFEDIASPEAGALLDALRASLEGSESEVVTWLPRAGQPLRRAIFDGTGHLVFASPALTRDELLHPEAECTYRERLEAPQRLILLGAGDDAKPVCTMASLLGWNVVVADGRSPLARAGRFPEARSVTLLPQPRACVETLAITPRDAIVVMTHSYEQDRDCLGSVLAAPPQRYLGILGARHRTALLVTEAASLADRRLGPSCERIHAPVGLDLGGDGPEAIALAVVAEIQACLQGKLPASRGLTEDDVQLQLRRNLTTHTRPAQCAASSYEEVGP